MAAAVTAVATKTAVETAAASYMPCVPELRDVSRISKISI